MPTKNSSGDRPHGPAPASEHRDPAVSPGGDAPAPVEGHETQDVSIRPIVKFGVALAIGMLLIGVAMWALFRFYEGQGAKRDRPPSPLVAAGLKRTPPEPRLEPNPVAPRLAVRAREQETLGSYGWVDVNAGVARIPIERAMELLVERGLPPSKPMMPVVTPGPGSGKRETGDGKGPTR